MTLDADPSEAAPARVPRGARRAARTRTSILSAAIELFAERGIDGTRVIDITERADVGAGSFYNHFADKVAVIGAVVAEAIEREGAAVDRRVRDLEDPAEVVAVAHRHFVRLAGAPNRSGWLLARVDLGARVLEATVGPRAAAHLDAGLRAGRFEVPDRDAALVATGGALVGAMRAARHAGASPGSDAAEGTVLSSEGTASRVRPARDEAHAELVLRMLGLGAGEAAAIAARDLPAEGGDDAEPA